MILLLAISPIMVLIPVGVVAGVTGIVLWARKKVIEPPPIPGKPDEPDDAANGPVDDDVADAEEAAKKKKTSTRCERADMVYDSRRWHSPPPVIAALQKLGYPLTSLTSSSGRSEVMKFQAKAIDMDLMGLFGADAESIDGKPGPCTLISLSAAMNMYEAGNWPGA